MPSILEFANKKRRQKKTRNCYKGYNCGNSCINKGRKCKRKFSNQASTYAGWLKKNGQAASSTDSKIKTFKPNKERQAIAKELDRRGQQIEKDLSKLVSNDGLNRQKVIRITEISSPSGDESFFEVDYADNSKGKGKGYYSQSDLYKKIPGSQKYIEDRNKLYADVAKFNSASVAARNKQRSSSGRLSKESGKKRKLDNFIEAVIDSNGAGVNKPQLSNADYASLRARKKELNLSSKDVAEKIREKILSKKPNYDNLGRNGKSTYDIEKKQILDPDLIGTSKSKLQEQVDYLLSNRRVVNADRRSIDNINGYRALVEDYDQIANEAKKIANQRTQNDPFKRNPGESAQDFFKRRNQDPEVQKRKLERDKSRRGARGQLPEAPIGAVGTSGLGGKKRRRRSQNFSEQSIQKGSTVTWKWGKGKANGKVLAVYHRSVSRKLGDSSITRNGTKDNPAYLIGQNDGSKILKLQSELIF